ncbi:cobyric acid synthase [Pseudothermotoga thermarum]|uniref:Cobyric acid synthase n=1 Tax=Pseudothermotoga thermarum DSM 5069 TaxID=688269 RepID=F7YVV1_9THEM|nr:cobyric acid synthase [Pseudothermotoga thermarum]AEH51773.1 cobyric acid synthase CobQ [Pseudothermotoga thermarum DSM 5069]
MKLMILGTMSNVGKSLFTVALCRYFSNLGYKVAPFKAQNMSLNSIVSVEGGEMALSQYIQAIAARTVPSVLMNPILLKPDVQGIEIIAKGKPIDFEKSNRRYMYDKKLELLNIVLESFNELAKSYEIVILEGSGGTAEINLKEREINNITLAKILNCPAILIADISNGGAFAQVAGTFELLDDEERDLIKGFLFNKFHGDPTLLQDYPEKLAKRYNTRFLGTVTYIEHNLPEEDILSKKIGVQSELKVDIIKLPRFSNTFDFDPLFENFDVALVEEPRSDTDVIIIPGTKLPIHDLRWLKNKKDAILKSLKNKAFLIGICGGFQILGEKLIELDQNGKVVNREDGLGLLPIETVFHPYKITCWLTGKENLFGTIVEGYEIHRGISTPTKDVKPFAIIFKKNNAPTENFDGVILDRIIGTCFHHLFHNHQFFEKYFTMVAEEKGKSLDAIKRYDLDAQIELIAYHFTNSIDMESIFELIRFTQ